MKIGVSSYSFSKYMRETGCNYFKICDLAKEMGYEGIEFIDLNLDVQPAESQIALAQEIRAYCESISLPIAAYTIGADFIDRENEVERLKGQVDVAVALGVKVMRHDVTWRRDIDWREIVARTAPMVREVAEYAASKGVITCSENHGMIMQDAHRVEELILTVNHPNYRWLVDMGNFLCADEPPMHALPIAAKYAVHAHAKDFIFKSSAPSDGWIITRGGNAIRGTIVGHGVVPIADCVAELRAAGYDGWLSLEFEGMEDNLTALKLGLQHLKKVVAN
ncbi:MAG: sugar phosphate isomerase/epimerase [Clostridia bacterium]|nr:sugar phosphate isomerase/epimerase [Clostridia bacterium]